MMLIFAPVSFSNSGARRCSGSWIAPVCVMTLTVTPSNSPAWAPSDDASANIAPAIAVDMLNIFAMLSFLPVSSAPAPAGVSVLLPLEPARRRTQGLGQSIAD